MTSQDITLREKFHQQQWDFYQDKGLRLAKQQNAYGYYFPVALSDKDKTPSISYFYTPKEFIQFMISKTSFHIKHLSHHYEGLESNDKTYAQEIFSICYQSAQPQEKKLLMKDYISYAGVSFSKSYEQFMAIFPAPKDKIDFLRHVSISTFEAKNTDFEKFHDFLQKNGLADTQPFMVTFLKARKNQIKEPKVGAKIKNFLKKHYHRSQLEEFFPFFPFLKADYEEVDLNIFDDPHKLSTICTVDLKKVVQKYGIKEWNETNYFYHFCDLKEGIKNYFGGSARVVEADKKRIIKLELSHDNPLLTQDIVKELTSSYLRHLQSNPSSSPEIAKSWIQQYFLQKQLTQKPESAKCVKI